MTSYAVGHGDCTLVEYEHAGVVAFRCLVDGGTALPTALVDHLEANRRGPSAHDIDVLVLSHVDNDHQGGLPALLDGGFTIGEYLGPCLPAFERLRWLFAPRVRAAVERATTLEEKLAAAHVPVTYPMEGYASHHANRRVTLSVISPAQRLLKRLATSDGEELASLLAQPTLPLQWLLDVDPGPEPADDDLPLPELFDGRVSHTPAELRGRLPATRLVPADVAEAAQARGALAEPEFFGNAVLNDTSLVLVVDVHLDGSQRKRLLLTGDQENWTYVAARHPAGLGIDVLKAPHHGGRLYLADRQEDFESLYVWLRPRTVLVSADGRHQLPRNGFRDALRKVGATLVCPNVRGVEALAAGSVRLAGQDSCFATMGCRAERHSTLLELSAGSETADRPACVQGTGAMSFAPIVVLNQHVTSPSEALVRYTQGELERHAGWLARQLQTCHEAFKARVAEAEPDQAWNMAAQQLPVPWTTLAAHARADGRHDLVHDPAPVLAYGRSRRMFWVAGADGHRRRDTPPGALHRMPKPSEIEEAWAWLRAVPRILLCSRLDRGWPIFEPSVAWTVDDLLNVDRIDVLRRADWTIALGLLAGQSKMPVDVVSEEILGALLPRIADHFRLRICWMDHPRSDFTSSLSPKGHYGAAYYMLEGPGAPRELPDLHRDEWIDIWDWDPSHHVRPWRQLRDLAVDGLLAGNFDSRRMNTSRWTSAFVDPYRRVDATAHIGEWIDQAAWLVLWP